MVESVTKIHTDILRDPGHYVQYNYCSRYIIYLGLYCSFTSYRPLYPSKAALIAVGGRGLILIHIHDAV